MSRMVDRIVLHCSASDYENQTAKWIDKIHKARGWEGIGYHFFVRKNGLLERGRGLDEVGAHVYGHNRNSIGVCLAGLKRFNHLQYESLTTLLLLLKRLYPNASLLGHRDLDNKKTCPVFDLDRFSEIWNGVSITNGLLQS